MLLLEHPDWLEGFLDEQLENLLRSAELAELLHQTRRLRAERGEGFSPALLIEHVAPHSARWSPTRWRTRARA